MTLIANLDEALGTWPGKSYVVSIASFLRPADAVPYAAGDVISAWNTALPDPGSDVAHALVFPGCGNGGGAVMRVSVNFAETDAINLELYLFDAEPTNFEDNAPLALVAADVPKLVGVYTLASADKTNIGADLEHYIPPLAQLPHPYAGTQGQLFGLLVTRSAYTPTSGMKVAIRLGVRTN